MASESAEHKATTAKPVRLQSFLARAGVGSRRQCERLIDDGRVKVDGDVVTRQGLKIDPNTASVEFDGSPVRPEKKAYYLLNKPRGVVCSNDDEMGRTGAVDLLKDLPFTLNTVGRLDKDSEGLIILTNDGKLTDLLTHPRYQVGKVYHVNVEGGVTQQELNDLKRGKHVAEGKITPARIRIHSRKGNRTNLEIELKDGRNRAIRRILAEVGHPVRRLRRVAIGPVSDSKLQPGRYRKLSRNEVDTLFRCPNV